jgi:hypothetical protein
MNSLASDSGWDTDWLADRVGFEPTIRLPVCRISSAVLSTAQPPVRGAEFCHF